MRRTLVIAALLLGGCSGVASRPDGAEAHDAPVAELPALDDSATPGADATPTHPPDAHAHDARDEAPDAAVPGADADAASPIDAPPAPTDSPTPLDTRAPDDGAAPSPDAPAVDAAAPPTDAPVRDDAAAPSDVALDVVPPADAPVAPSGYLRLLVRTESPSSRFGVGVARAVIASAERPDHTLIRVTERAAWSVSDPGVLRVEMPSATTVQLVGVAPGEATVTATYMGLTGTARYRVEPVIRTALRLVPSNPVLVSGQVVQLGLFADYSDGTTREISLDPMYSWSLDRFSVVDLAANARTRLQVTARSPGGTASLTVRYEDLAVSASVGVTYHYGGASMEIAPSNPVLGRGHSLRLHAEGTWGDGSPMSAALGGWVSSDPAVVTTTARDWYDWAEAVAPGVATLSAGGYPLSGRGTITVTDATLERLELSPATASVAVGYTLPLVATAVWSDGARTDVGYSATWTTTGTAIPWPGSRSLARMPGVSVVTATYGGQSASATVTVTEAAVTGLAIVPTPVVRRWCSQWTAIGTFADGSTLDVTDHVTWTSSAPWYADFSYGPETGLLVTWATGTTTITASLDGHTASREVPPLGM